MEVSESAVRHKAKRLGYRVEKSRDRSIHLDNRGEYMLIDNSTNFAVLGYKYDASLEQIVEWLTF